MSVHIYMHSEHGACGYLLACSMAMALSTSMVLVIAMGLRDGDKARNSKQRTGRARARDKGQQQQQPRAKLDVRLLANLHPPSASSRSKMLISSHCHIGGLWLKSSTSIVPFPYEHIIGYIYIYIYI